MIQDDLLSNELTISANSQVHLMETAKWGKFLAVTGFVLCGFTLLVALMIPSLISSISPYNGMNVSAPMITFITVIYVLVAFIFFVPCLYLLRYSNKMKAALLTVNQEQFEDSLGNLKSIFRFYGVIVIIIVGFNLLAFLAGMFM